MAAPASRSSLTYSTVHAIASRSFASSSSSSSAPSSNSLALLLPPRRSSVALVTCRSPFAFAGLCLPLAVNAPGATITSVAAPVAGVCSAYTPLSFDPA